MSSGRHDMLDCLISGGEVIDGSGRKRWRADVGIRGGQIVGVGKSHEPARQHIDARGMIVTPGFVDVHTHYDAQAFWDRTLSPSLYHGVTTVVAGNCGFSIAPLTPEAGDYLMHMLSRVEGMPIESLRAGVPWDWHSFADYLARHDGALALNAGFMVGHSALRRVVMGEAATGEAASEEQVREMARLLGDSLSAGGLGFSSSQAQTHNDTDGQPVPSRAADRDEMLALCAVVREHAGTTLEFIPTVGAFSDEHVDLMASMSLTANRPLNWNVLGVGSGAEPLWRSQLAASDQASTRGAKVVALTLVQIMALRLNFISGFVLDALPGWAEIIALPLPARKEALGDPAVRERLDKGAHSEGAGVLRAMSRWETYTLAETFTPETKRFEGKRVGELAAELGKQPFDTLLDIVVADDLKTSLMPMLGGNDEESWKLRAEVWLDPRTIVGASDAGAHLDMIDTFSFSTSLLGPAARDRSLLSLEEAVHQLTGVPARHYGLRGRGRLGEGYCADVTVFDADRIAPQPVYMKSDLPGGARRVYGEAEGVEHVLVNGREIVRKGRFTGQYPGTVLRSGRDTETVEVPGGSSA